MSFGFNGAGARMSDRKAATVSVIGVAASIALLSAASGHAGAQQIEPDRIRAMVGAEAVGSMELFREYLALPNE